MWSNCKPILVRNQNYGFKNNYETTFIWIKVDWAPCHTVALQAKKETKTVPREGHSWFPRLLIFLMAWGYGAKPFYLLVMSGSVWANSLSRPEGIVEATGDAQYTTILFITVLSISKISFKQNSVIHLFQNFTLIVILLSKITEGYSL